MTDREKLIEAMARAICKGHGLRWEDQNDCLTSGGGNDDEQEGYRADAIAALTAIAEQGYAVVPNQEMETLRRERDDLKKSLANEIAGRDPCPFDNPRYELDLGAPCPVCGDLGYLTDEVPKCVSLPYQTMRSRR